MKQPAHICLIRLSAMGDVAMLVPVVYALTKAYPELKVTVVSKPFLRPIIETIPKVNFVPAEVNGKHKGILGLWRLSRELKSAGVDTVADMHQVLRSKILRFFLRLPSATMDKGRGAKKVLINGGLNGFKQLKTTITRYNDVLSQLGFKSTPEALPRAERSAEVEKFSEGEHMKWLGVAPFAAHVGKQYPEDLMKSLIQQIDREGIYQIFLFGGLQDKEALLRVSQGSINVKITTGSLTFSDEIRLISQLDAMISMDSGNAHLAAMYNVPTVTLWGVTHPFAGFAPFEQENGCVLSDRQQYPLIPTSVYGNKVPEGYEDVMRSIQPQQILAVLDQIAP